MLKEYRNYKKIMWRNLSISEKKEIWNKRTIAKNKYKKKYNWLWKKQMGRRKAQKEVVKEKKTILKYKRDKERYKFRKQNKLEKQLEDTLQDTIINKSNIPLQKEDMLLLQHGLNFTPTPNWTENIERTEWGSLLQHIRKVE